MFVAVGRGVLAWITFAGGGGPIDLLLLLLLLLFVDNGGGGGATLPFRDPSDDRGFGFLLALEDDDCCLDAVGLGAAADLLVLCLTRLAAGCSP